MSVNPEDPDGKSGTDQEQPPMSNPIPDETQRPDIVAPQHDPQPLAPDEDRESEDDEPDS